MINTKEIQAIKSKSKIDEFYVEFLLPAIPVNARQKLTVRDIANIIKNITHLVGKRLVNERSILDNKLTYRNLSLTNKNTKRKAA